MLKTPSQASGGMWAAGSTSEAADTPCAMALRYGFRFGVGVTIGFRV